MDTRQQYNISVATYNVSGVISVIKMCNGFTATNIGDTICEVNGMILYPGTPGTILGDSRSIGGNENEVYAGNIKVAFANPGGAQPLLEIVQKFFVSERVIGSDTGLSQGGF
jgi:hypothetical protein